MVNQPCVKCASEVGLGEMTFVKVTVGKRGLGPFGSCGCDWLFASHGW
jgi:hypothetical protein